eukprot:14858109-Alexandrium_andersonii.AAC.1
MFYVIAHRRLQRLRLQPRSQLGALEHEELGLGPPGPPGRPGALRCGAASISFAEEAVGA